MDDKYRGMSYYRMKEIETRSYLRDNVCEVKTMELESFSQYKIYEGVGTMDGNPCFNSDAWQKIFRFPSGLGASVIHQYLVAPFPPSERDKLWVEIAVIRFNGPGERDFDIVYVTKALKDNYDECLEKILELPGDWEPKEESF